MPGNPTASPMAPQVSTTSISVLAARRAQEGSAWDVLFHIFDWQFEHYLTPWIIRIMWLLMLLGAGLGTCAVGLKAAGVEFGLPGGDVAAPQDLQAGPLLPPAPGAGLLFASRAVLIALGSVGAIMFLLTARVVFETLIVVFNIATTLTAIEKKLDKR